MSNIYKALQERILVLDGAMGTMLQAYKFTEEDYRGERFKDYSTPLQGNNDLLSLTQPKAIADVHRKYFEAGADIVERIVQERYKLDAAYMIGRGKVKELALAAKYYGPGDEIDETKNTTFALGQGLIGQCAAEGDVIHMTNTPDNFSKISSGLGKASARSVLIVPLKLNDVVYSIYIIQFKSTNNVNFSHESHISDITYTCIKLK